MESSSARVGCSGGPEFGWLARRDLAGLASAYGDPRLALPLGLPLGIHPEIAERMARARWRACLQGRMACLVPREQDRVLGAFTLILGKAATERAEVSFWVVPEAQGRGLGRRGLDSLLEEAVPRFDLRSVEARCLAVNRRARQLLSNRGFQPVAVDEGEGPAPGLALYRLDRV